MALYLVRHAKAGSRSQWDDEDIKRALSKTGWRQAEALADALETIAPTLLVSSPYLRCTQSLMPLARRLKVDIETDDRLAEAEEFEPVLEMLASFPDRTVLCSHGDVIPAVMGALARRGTEIVTDPDWRKATVWVLERSDGEIRSAACWPPPHV